MNPRVEGLARVLRQQPYEIAIALAVAVSSLASLAQDRGPGAAARVLPQWALRPVGILLALAALASLAGLLAAGALVDPVRRVLARRVEQAGQTLLSGVLFAVAIGAFSAGPPGTISGAVYSALAAASAARAAMIGHTFSTAGKERTDLAP